MSEWQEYDVFFPWLVKMPNGRMPKLMVELMRRRQPDGTWEYREATDAERNELQKKLTW